MSKRKTGAVLLLMLVLTVPFLNKAFHIDDTFVLFVTSNILDNPWSPFAGRIDWFGRETEVWQTTTNPPLLSYYLAPFAWLTDYSEVALHTAMIPFYLLLAVAMCSLARRFTSSGCWPAVFLITSAAVVVSGNVMRDVPGTALATAAVAAFIRGSDGERNSWMFVGSLLGGLAVLTKYSAAIVLPVMVLYALHRKRSRQVAWLSVSGAVLGIWCLHNWLVYGQVHVFYLLMKSRTTAGIVWQDKLFGALVSIGSCCLVFPALLSNAVRGRRWPVLLVSFVGVLLAGWGAMVFYEGDMDPEYLFWLTGGVLCLTIPVLAGLRRQVRNRDSIFLGVWCFGVICFSVFMVPFQAVRHLLPALPPLILIGFRWLEVGTLTRASRVVLTCLVLTQASLAVVVQLADCEYAASYRDFAERAREDHKDDQASVWYVGHWGWMFYADRAGFRQVHREGPFPAPGDVLLWPEKVHVGGVFHNDRELHKHLELVSDRVYEGLIPVRTMDRSARAGFYSVTFRKLPFRLLTKGPVEVMRTYRVTEEEQPSPP